VPIASVAGITIRVHVTFLALLALIALSAPAAGESVPGAVGWMVALFGCVVVHELSHALVARSKGIAVTAIDLLPIGGISRMERMPDDWRDELDIAVAGPAASFVLGATVLLAAAAAGSGALRPTLVAGPFVVRLGWANLLLAGFNLLPAFPLDGGRVLRATLERRMSRVAATRRAVRLSRVLAAAMIAAGLLANVWLIVIGMFVIVSGGAEEAAVLVHETLAPVRAADVAVPCPVGFQADLAGIAVVDEQTPLDDVLPLLGDAPIAVTRDGHVVGVITADEVGRRLRALLREAGR